MPMVFTKHPETGILGWYEKVKLPPRPRVHIISHRINSKGDYVWHPACPKGETYFRDKDEFRRFTKNMNCEERGPLTAAEKERMYNQQEPVLTESDITDAFQQVKRAETYKNDE